MQIHPPASKRDCRRIRHDGDLCVVGGGLAGTCCAIAAARQGLRVVLIQDRPVLGGNASSEVRLWVLGATAHLRAPNRWAREPGVIDEMLVENMWRNPEGNALIFDTIVLEWVTREPNITLLLNTAMWDVDKDPADPDRIRSIRAWCSQNQTMYEVAAPLFVDASGDGVLGFQAGAAFRLGAEAADEFGEPFAPDQAYGELLGQSIYFYSRDAGRPVRYIPPAFALRDIERTIPRYRNFQASSTGCQLWWIEYGGRLDPVHDTELIKWELWRVVYGVWDHIKNSGRFPREQTENLTLEWVGVIPGKREARRFEGDCILTQADVIERRHHRDAVAFGGWALDLHPADGVYSQLPGCTHWRMSGIYPIPYRCLYSRNIRNLFLAGRCISVSHVAFGTTRVMGTLALCGQAVGVAAAVCRDCDVLPAAVAQGEHLRELQTRLQRTGQHMPGITLDDPRDVAPRATIQASSTYRTAGFAPGDVWKDLNRPVAQLLPLPAKGSFRFEVQARTSKDCRVAVELRSHPRSATYIPETLLAQTTASLRGGDSRQVALDVTLDQPEPRYGFLVVRGEGGVEVRQSDQRLTGFVDAYFAYRQEPPADIGVEQMEVWHPTRRPQGRNLALAINPPLDCYATQHLVNGRHRPVDATNAWCPEPNDSDPWLRLTWNQAQTLRQIVIHVDTDWDHPMESVLMGHPESVMPLCVCELDVLDDRGQTVACIRDNHQTRIVIAPPTPLQTRTIELRGMKTHTGVPPAIFSIQCLT